MWFKRDALTLVQALMYFCAFCGLALSVDSFLYINTDALNETEMLL